MSMVRPVQLLCPRHCEDSAAAEVNSGYNQALEGPVPTRPCKEEDAISEQS